MGRARRPRIRSGSHLAEDVGCECEHEQGCSDASTRAGCGSGCGTACACAARRTTVLIWFQLHEGGSDALSFQSLRPVLRARVIRSTVLCSSGFLDIRACRFRVRTAARRSVVSVARALIWRPNFTLAHPRHHRCTDLVDASPCATQLAARAPTCRLWRPPDCGGRPTASPRSQRARRSLAGVAWGCPNGRVT